MYTVILIGVTTVGLCDSLGSGFGDDVGTGSGVLLGEEVGVSVSALCVLIS